MSEVQCYGAEPSSHEVNNELQNMLLLTTLLRKQIMDSPSVDMETLRMLTKLESSQEKLQQLHECKHPTTKLRAA